MVIALRAAECRADFGEHSEPLGVVCRGVDKVQSLMQEIKNNGVKASSVPGNTTFVDESNRKFYDLAKTNEALLITGNLKHYPCEGFIMNPSDFLHQSRGRK